MRKRVGSVVSIASIRSRQGAGGTVKARSVTGGGSSRRLSSSPSLRARRGAVAGARRGGSRHAHSSGSLAGCRSGHATVKRMDGPPSRRADDGQLPAGGEPAGDAPRPAPRSHRPPRRSGRGSRRSRRPELERQDAHADEVRAVDPLVALGDHRADAQEPGPLGRPVARRARAVLLAGQDDQRTPLVAGTAARRRRSSSARRRAGGGSSPPRCRGPACCGAGCWRTCRGPSPRGCPAATPYELKSATLTPCSIR